MKYSEKEVIEIAKEACGLWRSLHDQKVYTGKKYFGKWIKKRLKRKSLVDVTIETLNKKMDKINLFILECADIKHNKKEKYEKIKTTMETDVKAAEEQLKVYDAAIKLLKDNN